MTTGIFLGIQELPGLARGEVEVEGGGGEGESCFESEATRLVPRNFRSLCRALDLRSSWSTNVSYSLFPMVMETETEEDGKGEKIRGGRAILSKEQMCLQYTEGKGRSCSDPLPPSAEQRMNRFRFVYLGNAMLDRRYTQAMLPWIIAEVKRKKERQEIGLIVEYMAVKAVDCSTGDVIFQHKVQTITRCARSADKKCFAYLTKSPQDVSSCFCYVFEASDQLSVSEVTSFCCLSNRYLVARRNEGGFQRMQRLSYLTSEQRCFC